MWAAAAGAAGAAGGEGGDLAAQLDAAIVERISLLNDNRRLTNEVTELTLSLETARAQLNDVRVTNAQLQRAVQRVAAATVQTAQASPSSAAAGAEDGISQVLTETATAKASADRQVRHFVRECQRLRRVLASKQRQLVQLRSQQAPQGADGVEDDGVTAGGVGGVPTAVAGGEAGTSAALVVDDLGEFSDGEVDKEDDGDGGDGSGSGAANGSKRTTPRFDPMPASTAQALTQLRRRLARRTLQVRRLQQHLAEVVAPQLQEYKQAAAAAAAGAKVAQQGDDGAGAAGPGAGAGAGADSSSAPSQDEAVDAPSSADAFIQRMLAAEKRADVAARQLTQARLEARDNEDRARQFEDTCTKLQHQLAEAEAKLQGSGSGSSSSSQSQADVNEVNLLQQQVAELEARLQAESKRLRSQHTVRFSCGTVFF